MDFQKLICARYSVRAYKPDPIDDEKVVKVLEAARLAPTAANRQPVRVIVVKTEGRKDELKRVYHRDWFTQAPLVVCVCVLPKEAWVRKSDGWCAAEVDATIVMDHIVLAAADLGLGTCWIANFDPAAAREVLGLPKDVVPMLFTPLGYPADAPSEKKRMPFADMIRAEKW